MKYLRFPALKRDLSRLVLGAMNFDVCALAPTYEIMDEWMRLGGNIVDCAHNYGDGSSELALGRWLQDRGRRDEVVVLTKGAHQNADRKRVTPEDITCDLRDSLARLKIDVIDLYLLHRDDPESPVGPIMEVLNEHKGAGRIQAFGASNWTTSRLEEANAFAAAHGLEGFSCSSPNLSLATQNEPAWTGCISASDPEARAWYERAGLPLFAWSSQAGGFFTGRYSPANHNNREMVRVYYNEGNWERLRRAQELGRRKGYSAHQIALAWVLHQPFPTYAVIGPRSLEELLSSSTALEIELTPEEVRWLNLGGRVSLSANR